MFRQGAGVGTDYANMSMVNTVWNITLGGTSIGGSSFFNAGSGALTAATAGDAIDFSGADFNFSGSGAATLSDDVGAILIANLGAFDGAVAIGAQYDSVFVSNNFAAFGYGSEGALEADLAAAGWQVIPEASTYALLLAMGSLACVMLRRGRV